ncbi:hypothetical protein [Vibrio sp. V39_P1S14PM300]|uniref:hypothetical protein n=1 Tax=Vibrio sp. V39_P1S14PM300 TaxID=1938690 RepID=UPI0013727E79|nr:hypothetical protein [Vibrio sp. V39_P1S14PM300]NAX22741.1 hypothetical protein [Vibrio sp. V39_P1S14PM300]
MKKTLFTLCALFSSTAAFAQQPQACSADTSAMSPSAKQNYTQCCESDNGEACYMHAWRDLEARGKKDQASLYYQRSCDAGYASGCRTAGQTAQVQEEKDAWFNKGCDLKDLDSCLEVDRLPN